MHKFYSPIPKLVLICSILFLVACGGGSSGGGSSDDSTPTDPNQIFSLEELQSKTVGTIYSTSLTGSDSNGTSYTGSISAANRAEEMYGGNLASPTDLIISLTGGGSTITVTGTSYNDSSTGYLLAVIIQTTGVTCTPVSPDEIPTLVKIGDFGILSDLICDDNTTQSRNWRIEDGRNGKIKAISAATVRDNFNNLVSMTEVTYIIDGNNAIVGFKTTSELSSGYILTYQNG